MPGLVPEEGLPGGGDRDGARAHQPHRGGRLRHRGGQFQEVGIPTVICGPGSIRQAHQPNEYIELSQVRACEAFMRRLLDEVCAA